MQLPSAARFIETPGGNALRMDGRIYPSDQPTAYPLGQGMVKSTESGSLQWTAGNGVTAYLNLKTATREWLGRIGFRPLPDFAPSLTQCVAQGGSRALGVVTIRVSREVSTPFTHFENPVVAQALVSIDAKPLRINFIRLLPSAGKANSDLFNPPRLFPWQGGLLCIGDKRVEEIDGLGKPKRTVAVWRPDTMPVGESAGRWLLGERASRRGYELWATDLPRAKSFCLYRVSSAKRPDYYPYVLFGTASNTSKYVLVFVTFGGHPEVAGDAGSETFTLRLPDGHRQTISGYPEMLIGDYAVGHLPDQGNTSPGVAVYSAATGHILRQYR